MSWLVERYRYLIYTVERVMFAPFCCLNNIHCIVMSRWKGNQFYHLPFGPVAPNFCSQATRKYSLFFFFPWKSYGGRLGFHRFRAQDSAALHVTAQKPFQLLFTGSSVIWISQKKLHLLVTEFIPSNTKIQYPRLSDTTFLHAAY